MIFLEKHQPKTYMSTSAIFTFEPVTRLAVTLGDPDTFIAFGHLLLKVRSITAEDSGNNHIWVLNQKIGEFPPKKDGENNGKPY